MPGHAPTNMDPPPFTARGLPFGHPAMEVHRKKGGRNARSKERECLEALQNADLDDLDAKCAKLTRRFPPGMVYRLRALHDVASDPEHKDFMNAQRMVSDILKHLEKKPGDQDPAALAGAGVPIIELAHGSVEMPLPGSVAPQEPEGAPAGADCPVNGNGHQRESANGKGGTTSGP